MQNEMQMYDGIWFGTGVFLPVSYGVSPIHSRDDYCSSRIICLAINIIGGAQNESDCDER